MEKKINAGPVKAPFWLRLGAAILLALVVFWLPVEDTGTGAAQLFGGMIAAAAAAGLYFRLDRLRANRFGPAVAGLLAGLAALPAAVLLLVLKIGLHSHSQPDFTLQDLLAVLSRLPVWALGGTLIGAGLQPLLALSRSNADS